MQRLQIAPLRCAPVGMTRGEWLLTQKYATWMDGDKSGYSAKTADPSTALPRSAGRDEKGRTVTDLYSASRMARKISRSDSQTFR